MADVQAGHPLPADPGDSACSSPPPTAQRRELVRLRNVGEIGDDALNAVQRELDLEEERLDS
jgi:hypothetical protein